MVNQPIGYHGRGIFWHGRIPVGPLKHLDFSEIQFLRKWKMPIISKTMEIPFCTPGY